MKKTLSVAIIFIFTLNVAAPCFAKDVPDTVFNISMDVSSNKVTYNPIEPLTLTDCYELALQQSELIAINTDLIKEAEARFLQALSIMMPYISFQSTDLQEETPNIGGTFGTLKSTKFSERQFQIKQTIFSGFKAIAAMKGSGLEKMQRKDEKLRAEQLLLVDVANAFYLYLELLDDYRALYRIKAALKDRIKELRFRESLGRSRQTEVVNAKTQLYTVESNLKLVRNQQVLSRQLLEFLIGRPVSKLSDSYPVPDTLLPEEYYVAKFENRPDLRAADYARKFAKAQLDVINSDFLPTVSWQGNFYTQRTAFDKGTDWDVMLKMDIPIFSGTETLGKSKEYKLKAHESELLYERLRRKAPYDIKDAYVKFATALAVHDDLRSAYTTAKLNYYLQRKDYRRSLVSNLDVLAAIQTLQDSQRSYIHALYEAKRLYWQLRVSTGESIWEALNDII